MAGGAVWEERKVLKTINYHGMKGTLSQYDYQLGLNINRQGLKLRLTGSQYDQILNAGNQILRTRGSLSN